MPERFTCLQPVQGVHAPGTVWRPGYVEGICVGDTEACRSSDQGHGLVFADEELVGAPCQTRFGEL